VRRLTLKVPSPDLAPGRLTEQLRSWAEPDVIFTSFASWDEVSRWWWELARDRFKPNAAIREEAARLVADAGTPRERLEALHGFVASRVRYLSVSFGLGRMQPRPAGQVFANRYGDCKDQHALLAAMAAAAGLDVRPVLVNTSRAELQDEVPSPQQFDHMISVARLGPEPEEWLWLDATAAYGPPGYLGTALRDKRALLVEASGAGTLVRTPADPPFAQRTTMDVDGTLDADGTLGARYVVRLRSDAEVALRAALAAVPQERRADSVRRGFGRDFREDEISNIVVSDPANVREPLRIEFQARRTVGAKSDRREWGLWVPVPDFRLPEPEKDAPSSETGIDLEVGEFAVHAEVRVPESLSALAPLSVTLDRPFGHFESRYRVEGGRLELFRTLRITESSLPASETASFQAFREAIAKDHKQEFRVAGGLALDGSPSAEKLRADGVAALEKEDYATAVDLLRRATDADPGIANGFQDLGRALSGAGRDEEAVEVLSRQIEATPFSEKAYAWRAYALERLGRLEEAERDLLKQIEVAPFQVWPYDRLGERRFIENRFREAADLYARAAAIEPKSAKRWANLGQALVKDGRPDEARPALERALTLDPPDWLQVRVALACAEIGDTGPAREAAVAALRSMSQRLSAIAADSFGTEDLYWMERIAEAWVALGKAAATEDDPATAERYLNAAWRLRFQPEAGWALGELRERQGRLAEAVELWTMASTVPTGPSALPAGYADRIEAARRRLGQPRDRFPQDPLTELRTVRISRSARVELAEPVLLLAAADGKVERIRGLGKNNQEALSRQLAALGTVSLPLPWPDESPTKTVRRSLLVCSKSAGCSLILDLPGQRAAEAQDVGTIGLLSLSPAAGSNLRPGQQVDFVATVRYELREAERGAVFLSIQDDAQRPLFVSQPTVVTTRTGGEVTLKGTFTVADQAHQVGVLVALVGGGSVSSTVASAQYLVE
jgi:tetratricopeptide (TPR) repeat protein